MNDETPSEQPQDTGSGWLRPVAIGFVGIVAGGLFLDYIRRARERERFDRLRELAEERGF